MKAKEEGRRVVAVGTTSTRALEASAANGFASPVLEGSTNLFIYPGYKFKVVDALLTNFHLPESTLLMLVCAFAGRELTLEAYREAVKRRVPVLQLWGRDVHRVIRPPPKSICFVGLKALDCGVQKSTPHHSLLDAAHMELI